MYDLDIVGCRQNYPSKQGSFWVIKFIPPKKNKQENNGICCLIQTTGKKLECFAYPDFIQIGF